MSKSIDVRNERIAISASFCCWQFNGSYVLLKSVQLNAIFNHRSFCSNSLPNLINIIVALNINMCLIILLTHVW